MSRCTCSPWSCWRDSISRRGERQYHVRSGLGWFFDFQMPAMERLCNTGAELVSLPDSLLAGLGRKEGERNGA